MRKSVTLPEPVVRKIKMLAEKWAVSEGEAMRRILGVGSYFAEEIIAGRQIFTGREGDASAPPRAVKFPELKLTNG